MIILIGVICYFIVWPLINNSHANPTIREKDGIDFIQENDSTYVIKFEIDTVYKTPPDYDKAERP